MKSQLDSTNPAQRLQTLEEEGTATVPVAAVNRTVAQKHVAAAKKRPERKMPAKPRLAMQKKEKENKEIREVEAEAVREEEEKASPDLRTGDPATNADVLRLQSEIEIMNITVRHAKEETKVLCWGKKCG